MMGKKEYKVDRETAERDFETFAEEWGIDTDLEDMDEESRDGFEQHKRRIVRAIMSGNAVVDGHKLSYTPLGDSDEITFKRPKGRALLAMDNAKESQHMRKMFEFLGSVTGQAPKVFSNMDGRDLKLCSSVASLFLVS
jgi:hypothetical protein